MTDMTKDDGQTVALPLTQEQAREILRRRVIATRIKRALGVDVSDATLNAVLSAPPEVLAAALPDDTVVEMVRAKGWETRGL